MVRYTEYSGAVLSEGLDIFQTHKNFKTLTQVKKKSNPRDKLEEYSWMIATPPQKNAESEDLHPHDSAR